MQCAARGCNNETSWVTQKRNEGRNAMTKKDGAARRGTRLTELIPDSHDSGKRVLSARNVPRPAKRRCTFSHEMIMSELHG